MMFMWFLLFNVSWSIFVILMNQRYIDGMIEPEICFKNQIN